MEEHAHHFLTRLDRLSIPHVELALSLYRDQDLLKHILDAAKVPNGEERVALSLADPQRGPFLVVTRNGKFVTCLGEGMSKGALMVITREKMDGIATKAEVLRGRIEVAMKVTGERGGVGRLFRRLYDAGPRLSREEFIAVAAWQPMLVVDFLRLMVDATKNVEEAKVVLIRQLRRTDKLDPKFSKVTRGYYNSLWFIGHMSALAALDGRLPFEDLHPKAYEAMQEMPFSWATVHQGLLGPALRGIWGAGRMGKMLLTKYKSIRREAGSFFDVIESSYSLAAIGLRHSRLAAEVEKELASPLLGSAGTDVYQKVLNIIAEGVLRTYKATREKRNPERASLWKFGAEIAVELGVHAKPGSRFKFARIEDVPDDIAYAFPFNTPQEFVGNWKNFRFLTVALPWLAAAEAEQFYFPAEYVSEMFPSYHPAEIMPLLLGFRNNEREGPGETRSTPKGSARNEPCPCGSGLKYKRCCVGKTETAGDKKVE